MAPPFPKRKRQSSQSEPQFSSPPSTNNRKYLPPHQFVQPPPRIAIPTITTLQPKIWTTIPSPIVTTPKSLLKLTWHLCNPSPIHAWSPPMIISMLLCKSSAASAILGAWTDDSLNGDQVLLRTKYDLDVHEGRYEYLTETVEEPVVPGESVDVSAELNVPEGIGRYWGCFKVLREGEREFYCAFK